MIELIGEAVIIILLSSILVKLRVKPTPTSVTVCKCECLFEPYVPPPVTVSDSEVVSIPVTPKVAKVKGPRTGLSITHVKVGTNDAGSDVYKRV